MGDRIDLPWILMIAAIVGPVSGIIILYVYAWLVRMTGEWLGGEASGPATRAAVAWPNVMIIAISLIWIPEIAFFGRAAFMSETESPVPVMAIFLYLPIALGGAIWSVVALAKCVGEVQGFSAWKGLLNALIAGLLFALPFIAIAVAIRVVSS
jgi:hypothetical protein